MVLRVRVEGLCPHISMLYSCIKLGSKRPGRLTEITP